MRQPNTILLRSITMKPHTKMMSLTRRSRSNNWGINNTFKSSTTHWTFDKFNFFNIFLRWNLHFVGYTRFNSCTNFISRGCTVTRLLYAATMNASSNVWVMCISALSWSALIAWAWIRKLLFSFSIISRTNRLNAACGITNFVILSNDSSDARRRRFGFGFFRTCT